MFQLVLYFIGITLCTMISVFIALYLVKLWQIKSSLERFLRDLKNLDRQLNVLDTVSAHHPENDDREEHKPSNVCENCQNLKLFVPPDHDKVFLLWCSLHDREVESNDTCMSFKMDLFKWKIE